MTDQQPKEVTPHDELVYQKGAASKLDQMLKHPGWTEVLEPILKADEKKAEQHLLNGEIKDYNEFIQTRSNTRAIKRIFGYIKSILAQGEYAAEKLNKEKEEE